MLLNHQHEKFIDRTVDFGVAISKLPGIGDAIYNFKFEFLFKIFWGEHDEIYLNSKILWYF